MAHFVVVAAMVALFAASTASLDGSIVVIAAAVSTEPSSRIATGTSAG